ncbi:beta-fructofuranosidase, insoluble isoenzyme 1-like [Primulina huaijiensis]|uniref:beta-fructofuranosidase, insoluble isoenzyme 1-like n=1 Tax=Primulina huaijiensis TaxID=1492673 RepID=UPI003CC7408E
MIDGCNGLRSVYGNFYASKSFFYLCKSRRILWGWANESDTTENDVKKDWAGIQLIPRTIVMDLNGKQLLQWPVEELETVRRNMVKLSNKELVKGHMVEIKGITAAHVLFFLKYRIKEKTFHSITMLVRKKDSTVEGWLGPFGLVTLGASVNLEEYAPVFFRVFKAQDKHLVLLCSDASRSTLMDGISKSKTGINASRPSFAGFVDVDLTEKYSYNTLVGIFNLSFFGNTYIDLCYFFQINNSAVESSGARGKTCITSRVYPTLATYNNAHLFVFNNGTELVKIDSLNDWSMSKPLCMTGARASLALCMTRA